MQNEKIVSGVGEQGIGGIWIMFFLLGTKFCLTPNRAFLGTWVPKILQF